MASDVDGGELDSLLDACETVLGYRFDDRGLLSLALTHASIARTRSDSNERIEFLGDAILGAVVCEMLYRRFPDEPEGDLTRMKSTLVSRRTCAVAAERMGLDDLLMTGKGLSSRSSVPTSVNAAVYEAIVGALYLDGGLEVARAFVEKSLADDIDEIGTRGGARNFKSRLQQLAQRASGETPVYRLLDEKGPDHSKCFEVAAYVGETEYPSAWGPNKKEAEQLAARNALRAMEGAEPAEASE